MDKSTEAQRDEWLVQGYTGPVAERDSEPMASESVCIHTSVDTGPKLSAQGALFYSPGMTLPARVVQKDNLSVEHIRKNPGCGAYKT